MNNFKTIGILGGLGPGAGIDFANRLIELNTKAHYDQDHPPFILFSASNTPDRAEFVKGNGESPLPAMIGAINSLEKAGANFGVIACNTAHVFWEELVKNTKLPLLSLVEETAKFCATNYPNEKKVGILATNLTIESRIYAEPLRHLGIELVAPNGEFQEGVAEAIKNPEWGIKGTGIKVSEKAEGSLIKAVEEMKKEGIRLVILGCTEVSMVKALWKIPEVIIVDAVEVLAKKCLMEAGVKLD